MFFPESNIWNETTLRENVHEHDGSYNLDMEVDMVQTVSEKQEFMNVEAEIGLSFMGMTDYRIDWILICLRKILYHCMH